MNHEQQIESLEVIPVEPSVDVGAIRKTAQNFGNLHETVARNVGMLLKLAVECCHQLVKKLKDSQFSLDATKVQKVQEYRARVKCAMIYAGMVQYKVGRSTNSTTPLRPYPASMRLHVHGLGNKGLTYTCTIASDECV